MHPHLRKPLEDVIHRNKGVNQETESHGICKTEDPTPEKVKGNFKDDGER